ncbi:MAG: hypothetical protein U5J82_03350 [Desulfobacterales bacterium]|nr:hypothetical protein [Desulfobacterales bacterium]
MESFLLAKARSRGGVGNHPVQHLCRCCTTLLLTYMEPTLYYVEQRRRATGLRQLPDALDNFFFFFFFFSSSGSGSYGSKSLYSKTHGAPTIPFS